MDEVRSKIAQYIAGEVKLDELIDNNRLSLPLQKKFKFDDTWITMNRKIGEAVIDANVNSVTSMNRIMKKPWKPSEIQQKRRNAVTVQDTDKRQMTNGCIWPLMEDWIVTADNKIRYAPMLQPLRKIENIEWSTGIIMTSSAGAVNSSEQFPVITSPQKLSATNFSTVSNNSYHTFHMTPGSYDNSYADSSS